MFGFLWDLSQNNNIAANRYKANRAINKADDAKEKAISTDERLDRMLLVMNAMWKLIEEKTELTEDDLKKKVIELDKLDGRLDSKYTPTNETLYCKKCGYAVSKRFRRCLMCGEEYPEMDVMDSISD